MDYNTNRSQNGTDSTDSGISKSERLIIGVFLTIMTVLTIFGNILVLFAIKREKQLQTKFNVYIANLAITDLTVAITAMSFYTTDNILGYWPFGKFLCGVWIFNDYGMTFASVFTIIVISVDRFWAVTWPTHYKTHHTKKKCILFLFIVWSVMVVLWLPACIVDRVRANTDDNDKICIWDPALNKKFVVVIAIVGHHGSFCLILFCYVKVFYILRKRTHFARKIRPKNLTTVYNLSVVEPSKIESKITYVPERKDGDITSPEKGGNTLKPEIGQTYSDNGNINLTATPSTSSTLPANTEIGKVITKRDSRAFVTLTYIIVGYVICWVPFHIVFDISAVSPDAVSDRVFQVTFWMTYLNSTINPFLYNFSNPEFRNAFKKILLRLH